MTAEQIINEVSSGKHTAEDLILNRGVGVVKLIKHFNLNPRQSTSTLANQIVDRLNEVKRDSNETDKAN